MDRTSSAIHFICNLQTVIDSIVHLECNTTSLCTDSDAVSGIGTMLARQQRRQVHLIAQARCKHIQLLLRRIGSDEAYHSELSSASSATSSSTARRICWTRESTSATNVEGCQSRVHSKPAVTIPSHPDAVKSLCTMTGTMGTPLSLS